MSDSIKVRVKARTFSYAHSRYVRGDEFEMIANTFVNHMDALEAVVGTENVEIEPAVSPRPTSRRAR